MSKLKSYFVRDDEQEFDHPMLRLLREFRQQPGVKDVRAEVRWPRDVLGYRPATICLRFNDNRVKYRDQCDDWDDDLNAALVQEKIQAVSEENETDRFALALRAAFRRPETRYGDGYFNSVLIDYLKHDALGKTRAVKDVLKMIPANRPSKSSGSYEDCREMIERIIRARAQELTKKLGYPLETAEKILVGAVAKYLDERFSVSDRRRLGWL